ncbi:unnamed protein product [Phytomonas sp. EM1]|nr:unnamed protein product [Phytomonas sp. EM1]|eukprot:CCW64754.1 unnamed protein product [Phytomonas sp. isolate EM1]
MEGKDSSSDSLTCSKENYNESDRFENSAAQSIFTNSASCTNDSPDSTCLSLDQLKHLKLLFEVYDYVHALASGILPDTSKNFSDKYSKVRSSNGVRSEGEQTQRKTTRSKKVKAAAKPHPGGPHPRASLMSGVEKTNSMKKRKGRPSFYGLHSSEDLGTVSFHPYDYWEYIFGFDEASLSETSLPDACSLLLMRGIDGNVLLDNSHEKNPSLNSDLANIIVSLHKLEKNQRLMVNKMKKGNANEFLIPESIPNARCDHSELEQDRKMNTKAHGESNIPRHHTTCSPLRTQSMAHGGHSSADVVSHSSSMAGDLSENTTNRYQSEEYQLIHRLRRHHESFQNVIKKEIGKMLDWKRLKLFCKSHEEIYDSKTNCKTAAVDGMTSRINMDHLLTLIRPLNNEKSLAECEHFAFDALGLPSTKGVPFRFFAWFVVGPLFNFFFPSYAAASSHTHKPISAPPPYSRCTSEGGSPADVGSGTTSSADLLHGSSHLKNHQQNGKRKMKNPPNNFMSGLILGEPPVQGGVDDARCIGRSGFCPWNVQHMEAIQQLFVLIDADADGRVTWDELILYALNTTQMSQPADKGTARRDLVQGNDATQEHVPFPIVKFFNFTEMPTNRSPWQATYPLVHHLYHRKVFTKLLVCEQSSGYITAGPDGLVKLWKPDLCFFRQNAISTTTNTRGGTSTRGAIPQTGMTSKGGSAHPSSPSGNVNRKGFTGKYSNKPPIVHIRHLLSARAAITDLALSPPSLGDAEVLAVAAIDGTVTLLRVISGEVVRTFLGVRYSEKQIASTSLLKKGSAGDPNGRTQGSGEGLTEVKKLTKPVVKISRSGVCSPFKGSVSRLPYTIRAYHDDSIEIFFGKTSKYFKGLVVVPPTFEHLVRHVTCPSDLLLNFGLPSGGMSPGEDPLSDPSSVERGESVPWFATAVAIVSCPSLFPNARRPRGGRDRQNSTHSESQDDKLKGTSKVPSDHADKLNIAPFTGCLFLGFENGVLQVFAVQRNWFSIHEWSMQENGYQEPPCVRRPLFSARIHSAAITRLIVSEATNSIFTVSDDATVCIRALSRLEAPALMQFGNRTANLHRHVSHGVIRGQRVPSPARTLLEHNPAIGHSKRVTCVCWSEQYRLLVTGGRDHMIIFWSPLMNRPIREIDVHNLANLAAQNPVICSLSAKKNLGACGYPVDVSFFIRSIPGSSSENGLASMETPLWLLVLTRQRVIFILHALTGRLVKALVDHSASSLALGDLFVARYEAMCDRLLLGGYCLRVWDIESDGSTYPNGYNGHRQPILYMNYVPDLTAFITADRDEIWVWKVSLEMVCAKCNKKSANSDSGNRCKDGEDPLSLGGNDSSILPHLIKSYPLGDCENESENEAKSKPMWRLKSKVMRSWHVSEGVSAVAMASASNTLARQEQHNQRELANGEDSMNSSASSLFKLKVGFQSNGSAGCVEYTLFVALLREAAVEQYGILNGAPLRRFALQPPASLTRSLNARVGEATDTLCSLCVGQRELRSPSNDEANEIYQKAQQNWSVGGRRPAKHMPSVFLCTVYNNTGPQAGLASIHHVQKDQHGNWGCDSETINESLEPLAAGTPLDPTRGNGKGKKRRGKAKHQSPKSPAMMTSATGESGDAKNLKPYRQLVFNDTSIASIATVDALGLIVVGGDGRLHTTRMSELTSRALPCWTLEELPNDARSSRRGSEKRGSVECRSSLIPSLQDSRRHQSLPSPPLHLMAIFHGRLVPRPTPLFAKTTPSAASAEMCFTTHAPTTPLLSCLLPIFMKGRNCPWGVHLVVSGRDDGLVQLWDVDQMVECFRFQATWGVEIAVTALDYQCSNPGEACDGETNPLFMVPPSMQEGQNGFSSNDHADGFLAVGDQAGCVLLIGINSSLLLASRRLSEATTLESSKGSLTPSPQGQHHTRLPPKVTTLDILPSIYNGSRNARSSSRTSLLRRASIWGNSERAFIVLGRWNAHEHGSGGVRNVCFAGSLNYFERNYAGTKFEGENSHDVISQTTLMSTLSLRSSKMKGITRRPPTATEHLLKHTTIFLASAGADSFVYVWRWEQGLGVQCIGCFGGDDVAVWPRNSIAASGLSPSFSFPPHPSCCQAYEDARCQYVLSRLIGDACLFVVSQAELAALISPPQQPSPSHLCPTDGKSDSANMQTERKFLNEIEKALLFMSREVHALAAADPVWKPSANLLEKDVLKGHEDCTKALEKGAGERFRAMSITHWQGELHRNKKNATVFGSHINDYNSFDDRYNAPSFITSSPYASYVFAFMHGTYTNASLQECLEHTVRMVLATPEGLAAIHSASNKMHIWLHSVATEEFTGILSKTALKRRSVPFATHDENSREPRNRVMTLESGSVPSILPELSCRDGSMRRTGPPTRAGSLGRRTSTQFYDLDTVSSAGSFVSTQDHSKSTLASSRTNSISFGADLHANPDESPLGVVPQQHEEGTLPELDLEAPHAENKPFHNRPRLRSSYLKVPMGVAAAQLSRVSSAESHQGGCPRSLSEESRRATPDSFMEGSQKSKAGTENSLPSEPRTQPAVTRRRRPLLQEATVLKDDFLLSLQNNSLSKNTSNQDTRDTAAATGLQGLAAYGEFIAAAARAKRPRGVESAETHGGGGKKPLFEDFSHRGRPKVAGRAFIREILARHAKGHDEVSQTSAPSSVQGEGEDWYDKRERHRERQRREEAIWNTPRVMQSLMTWSSREPSEVGIRLGCGSAITPAGSTLHKEMNEVTECSSSADGKFQPMSVSSFGVCQDSTPFSGSERPAIPSFIPLYLNLNRFPYDETSSDGKRAQSPESRTDGSKHAASGTRSTSPGISSVLPRGKAFLQSQAEKEIAAMHFHRTVASEVETMRQNIRKAVLEREQIDCE